VHRVPNRTARLRASQRSSFERAMIRERTSAGLAAARAEGRVGGRRKKLGAGKRKEIADSVISGRKSVSARQLCHASLPSIGPVPLSVTILYKSCGDPKILVQLVTDVTDLDRVRHLSTGRRADTRTGIVPKKWSEFAPRPSNLLNG
jgi:hypothetical protein